MWVPNKGGRQLAELLEAAWCRAGEEVCKALQMIFEEALKGTQRGVSMGRLSPPIQQAAFKSLHVGCCSVGTSKGSKNPKSSFSQEEFDEMIAEMQETHEAEMEKVSADFGEGPAESVGMTTLPSLLGLAQPHLLTNQPPRATLKLQLLSSTGNQVSPVRLQRL